MSEIIVIVCSHNPNAAYLERTLGSLSKQTLSLDRWELLLIDNASDPALENLADLHWQPRGRIIRENKLGLTHARLRGIDDAKGKLLVFVDDDNVLQANYLEVALSIAESHPWLGVFGGATIGEYETPPPSWFQIWKTYVGVREIEQTRWSNDPDASATIPIGAGMVVRREVARSYAERVSRDSNRASLDRRGNILSGCGDLDLAFTACDLGLGMGVFPSLRLQHLIAAKRCEFAYMERLVEGTLFSVVMLKGIRGELRRGDLPPTGLHLLWVWLGEWGMSPHKRRLRRAVRRGAQRAVKLRNSYSSANPLPIA